MDKGWVKMGKPPSVDFYDLQMEVFPFLYNRKLRSLLYKNAPRDAHSREEEIGRQGDRARRESSASGTLCSTVCAVNAQTIKNAQKQCVKIVFFVNRHMRKEDIYFTYDLDISVSCKQNKRNQEVGT